MSKLFAVALLVAGYFIFLNDPYPSKVVFDGVEMGSRQDNNDSLNKDIDVFSYRDKGNQRVLLVGMVKNSPMLSVDELTEIYLANFKSQGFTFKKKGNRYLGIKGDTAMHMTVAYPLNAFIAFTEKGGDVPSSVSSASTVFAELENFIL